MISIHAAREGGDVAYTPKTTQAYISIHAAREGGDEAGVQLFVSLIEFQSTPPVKAATRCRAGSGGLHAISIHAAREGGDVAVFSYSALVANNFNPRRP